MIIKIFIKKSLTNFDIKYLIFDEELRYEIDHEDVTYCFKNNTAKNNFNDFDNGIDFKKMQCHKTAQNI